MKKIKLFSNTGEWLENKEFLNVREDLEIEILYDFDKNAEVYYLADNGTKQFKGLIVDNKFKIETKHLKKGNLKLKVVVVRAERPTQEFVIEGLNITEIDKEIYTIPEIVRMQEEVKELTTKYKRLLELVATLYNVKVGE